MGVETSNKTLIIARSEQIQKLHDILESLTEVPLGEGMQKHFMGSAEYAKVSSAEDDGYFVMGDVSRGRASNLDTKLDGLDYLFISSEGWNCFWKSTTFLDAHGLEYDWIVDSLWMENAADTTVWFVENKANGQSEEFTEEEGLLRGPNEAPPGGKPSELIAYGKSLFLKAERRQEKTDKGKSAFDIDAIPMEVLDKGWTSYRQYHRQHTDSDETADDMPF